MDSDSSVEGGEEHNTGGGRNWDDKQQQQSDVSDDENFSRGAKSIESPPESPPRGGGNLDSPPASPAQGGAPSPGQQSSAESSGAGSSPYRGSPRPPDSPMSNYESNHHNNKSPKSSADSSPESPPDKFQMRRRRLPPGYPRSPDKSSKSSSPDGESYSKSPSPRGRTPKSSSPERRSFSPRGQGPKSSKSSSPGEQRYLKSPIPHSRVGRKSPQSAERRSYSKSPSPRKRGPKSRRSSSPEDTKSPSPRSKGHQSSSHGRRSYSRSVSPSPGRDAGPKSACRQSYSKSPSPPRGRPKSPASPHNASDSNSSDDGRSNISSNSSIGSTASRRSSKRGRSPAEDGKKKSAEKGVVEIKSHGEDLSDVSDIESLGSMSDNDATSHTKKEEPKKEEPQKTEKDKKIGLNMAEDTEPLDFEEDREEGECEGIKQAAVAKEGGTGKEGGGDDSEEGESGGGDTAGGAAAANGNAAALSKKAGATSDEEGEVKELEEGELSDEGDNRPEETEPRPVCRFFSRGQCTWGSSCSFRHVASNGGPLPQSQLHPPPQQVCPPGGGVPRGFLARFIRPWIRRGGFLRFPFAPRFVHPGVTDKGNYTMFDMVRPLVPMNNGPPPHVYGAPLGPMDYHRPIDRVMPPPYQQPPIRKEEPAGESAWERGLRQAKELLRKSSKRKETEVDFEDKKLNLSITQDEFDKENDYYNRSGSSPYPDDHYDRYSYKSDGKRYRSVSDRFADYGPPAAVPSYYGPSRDSWHYDERSAHYPRHHQSDYHHSRGGSSSIVPPDDYYERKRHKYPSREVIVQRMDKSSWKEESPARRGSGRSHGERGSGGGRGDEWSDPWMRSKSPSRKVSSRSRKKSYSSRSSFSSSSSSRSSSYSSYSRSRTGSRSSRSSRSRSRSRARKKAASPLPRRSNKSPVPRGKVSPAYISEKRAETERSLHMNPPPPSPRGHAGSPSLRRNPTPPSASERAKGLSARLLAAAMRERSGSKSSWSSSGSDSSGSSSDSSSDSVSSSSSSRVASPVRPPPRLASSSRNKRIVLDEKLAQAMKVKAMDALKVSGQKQQIKLTLKGRDTAAVSERLQPALITGRKRPAESPPFDGEDSSSVISSKMPKKPAPSRREELLKQLKAVEDAIARKRSKV